jgi:hypothetical protein
VSEALIEIPIMRMARNRLSWAEISWPGFVWTFQCRYVSSLFMLPFISVTCFSAGYLAYQCRYVLFRSFWLVLLLELLLFCCLSVLICDSPLFLPPLPFSVAVRVLFLSSGEHYDAFKTLPVTLQLLLECKASKCVREHRELYSSCHIFVRSSSQHGCSNLQTHVSSTIHRGCWPISTTSSAERANGKTGQSRHDLNFLTAVVAGILQTEVVIRRRGVVADTVIGVSLLSHRIRHIFFPML